MAAEIAEPVETGRYDDDVEELDVIIIGAGNLGLYQLYLIKRMGLSVRAYDDAGGVGGTWYWNRYPGARFDSESESYGYSFSPELTQEWDWKEHFSGQPENERYFNYVADKFDLRDNIVLNTRVVAATYDESEARWEIELDDGRRSRAQFVVAAVGILSAHYSPDFPGIDDFEGESFHTSRWPREPVDLRGKRVAVIGAGASGVQVCQTIAAEVSQLTVYQRTPHYLVPLRNGPVTPEEQRQLKDRAAEIHRLCREVSPVGFMYGPDPRSALDYSKEERWKVYEELWTRPGFAKFLMNFSDLWTEDAAADDYSEFVREKIRERVHDPKVAEKLTPRTYRFGARRVPCEDNYYEIFNRNNVELVSVLDTPIERITQKGILTSDGEREFDVIIYATGFDSITGSLTRMDIRGVDGQRLADKWTEGFRTLLGMQTNGFPNLFIAMASSFCNYTVCAEMVAEWNANCIEFVRNRNFRSIHPHKEAEDRWMQHVRDAASQGVAKDDVSSWFKGSNIPGKASSTPLMYFGSLQAYRGELLNAARTFEEFILE